jgi:5-methylcytosine-specific restriction endonuclease McrA
VVTKVCMCGRIATPTERLCSDCLKSREATKRARSKQIGRNTAAWQRFRKGILERDGHACQGCGATSTLRCHKRHGGFHDLSDAGQYVTLCARCHAAAQKKERLAVKR